MTSYTIYKQNYFTQKKKGTESVPNECNATYLTINLRVIKSPVTRSKAKIAKQLSQGTKTRMRGKLGMFGREMTWERTE